MKKLALLMVLLSLGCASVVHQTTQKVAVTSDPAGAAVSVACGDVTNDPKLVTPAVVTVHRKEDVCSVAVTKDGYAPATVKLDKKMSPWYLGNLVIGGVIGFIVDGVNGAMFDRTPKAIDVKLTPAGAPSGGTK